MIYKDISVSELQKKSIPIPGESRYGNRNIRKFFSSSQFPLKFLLLVKDVVEGLLKNFN